MRSDTETMKRLLCQLVVLPQWILLSVATFARRCLNDEAAAGLLDKEAHRDLVGVKSVQDHRLGEVSQVVALGQTKPES